jgi:hypothetical protein
MHTSCYWKALDEKNSMEVALEFIDQKARKVLNFEQLLSLKTQ